MSTRIVAKKSRSPQSELSVTQQEDATGFADHPIMSVVPTEDEAPARSIDAIAEHVVAARYLSAEWNDSELNQLLDEILTKIHRTIAVLDSPRSDRTDSH